ncbi:MAG: hypothetical protein J2P46_14585 [Zavarzinella sp.]|nr:hypothetical protein [Zavarzinella sp.]
MSRGRPAGGRAGVPEWPASGQYQHSDGRTYVSRRVALTMGFTPVFLVRYRRRPHPALGRPLLCLRRKRFRFARAGGRTAIQCRDLYALTDLEGIQGARSAAESPAADEWPTLMKAAPACGLTPGGLAGRVKSGKVKVEVVKVPTVVRPKKLDRPVVQFVKVRRVCPEDLKPGPAAETGRVSLAAAAAASGIRLSTWHLWVRRDNCPALGKKLSAKRGSFETAHGAQREGPMIDRADYEAIVRVYEEAREGRLVRDGKVYLAPPTIAREFKLPEGPTSPRALLANRRHEPAAQLERTIDSIDGHYLGKRGKLIHGKCYLQEDVEALFRRVRPAPPPPGPQAAPRPGPAVPTGRPKEPAKGAFITNVDQDYNPAGCVRVKGQTVRVSETTFHLLKQLAQARQRGAGLTLAEMATVATDPYKVLSRFEKKARELVPDVKVIDRPGAPGRGGYRLC